MSVKLVRDHLQAAPGFVPCGNDRFRPVIDDHEHVALLLRKAHEELGELVEAVTMASPALILGEAADLIEVVTVLAMLAGNATPEQLVAHIEGKRAERGGFTGGLVWDHP